METFELRTVEMHNGPPLDSDSKLRLSLVPFMFVVADRRYQ
jgi:hypothetical protein